MLVAFALAAPAWAAPAQFTSQRRIGFLTGDQWEPAVAADASGHVFALYPHYGKVPGCAACRIPTMLLVVSADNGKTWQRPHVMFASGSGQFDAQIAVDPVDRRTVYAAWLENKKREVMLAKSVDSGATWSFTIAARSDEELDKPALAVRGQNVYLAFNHEEQVWVTASQDGGRSFTPARVNADNRPGWSLLGSATVDPAGNAYLAWASYSKAGGARGSVNLFVSKSSDAGKTWSSKSLDVSPAAPGCQEEECGGRDVKQLGGPGFTGIGGLGDEEIDGSARAASFGIGRPGEKALPVGSTVAEPSSDHPGRLSALTREEMKLRPPSCEAATHTSSSWLKAT